MILTEMIGALRVELNDEDVDNYLWTYDSLVRAIHKSVSLMSRLLPNRDILETSLVRTITGESLTIASSTGTLAYKPIKTGSLVITGKTLDTDYRINYLTGVVTEIGALLPDSPPTYTANYELDNQMLDISSLLPDYIKIERFEYPAGESPPVLIAGDVFGGFIVLRGNITLTENQHLRITYLKKWTPPTEIAAGDYPSHLDDAVIIGSSGQALIYKAEYYVQQAASALSVLTAPTLHIFTNPSPPTLPTAPTAPTAPTLSFIAAGTALTAVGTEITAAKAHHTTGAALANVSVVGDRPAWVYAEYADSLIRAAASRVQEGLALIKEQEDAVAKYASEVAAFGSEVNSYANEMSGTVGKYREQVEGEKTAIAANNAMIALYTAQANEQQVKAKNFLDTAGRYLASGQSKINEMLVMLGLKAEFPVQKASAEQRT